ncbi:MAG: UDP-N-acetylglucosamine 1-carboxyvinyltransferase [Candidatus Krumholzibacteria bacterium]|nr:UDP-N-acetylglucosamine 1-carboxyvinyltransferase [Candidatus Krumholzibacteria bacterium]
MAIFEVKGGARLEGEVVLSGAKNAALPMLFGSLLSTGTVELRNVPVRMADIKVAIRILRKMGASVTVEGTTVAIDPSGVSSPVVPADLASKIRYSLLLLGVMLVKFGRVELPFPGGCDIGTRKFDLHIKGLQDLGADIEVTPEGITGRTGGLAGAKIDFYLPTTSGTENVMLAACRAEGRTVIRNANTRPEIADFAGFLRGMGAKIEVSSRLVTIDGVRRLKGTSHTVMSGGDEAMTYMIAAGVTGSEIVIRDYDLSTLRVDVQYLKEAGMRIFEWGNSVYVSAKNGLRPFDMFTAPYPGVNSDLQPLFAVLALCAPGVSTITDQRFTDRFAYVKQLRAFGANIENYGNCAVVTGGARLRGARVSATDLRGGTATVLAGLAASGTTRVENVYQIDRGYENLEKKLASLGAKIRRIGESRPAK